jgi:EmrB/QacA subfamily drug resistance transporter
MSAAARPAAGGADAPLGRDVLAVAGVVVLGAVMSILDVTVVNVAINTLAREFDTDLATIQWVATGYTLALATVIPLTGWAADRFGTKRLYMGSIGLFMLGSAAAGLAWSAESIIAFRVLQGLGGGMIMPAGMTILTRKAGPARVGRVMAIVGVPMLLGPILGPILGGFLVDSVSWRWIFFINVPIGIVALICAARVLPRDEPSPGERFDALGLALLSPGLALLIYGLAQSGSHGGFGSAQVLVPILVGAVLLALFVLHALRVHQPLLDLRLFKNRTFSAATATLTIFAVAVFGGLLLLPLYLQAVRGETALTSGLLLAPQGIGAMITMPIAGKLTDRMGPGKIVLPGMVLILISFLGLTQIDATTSYWLLGGELFLMGLGMGASMMPVFSGAMQTLRRASVARASTALNILQQVGTSFGTAAMAVLLSSALSSRLGGGSGLGATAVSDAQRQQIAPAMADAFAATFWWAFGFMLLATAVALLLPRTKPEPVYDPDDPEAAGTEDAVPVLMG